MCTGERHMAGIEKGLQCRLSALFMESPDFHRFLHETSLMSTKQKVDILTSLSLPLGIPENQKGTTSMPQGGQVCNRILQVPQPRIGRCRLSPCSGDVGNDDAFKLHFRSDREATGVQEFDDAAVVVSWVTCMVLFASWVPLGKMGADMRPCWRLEPA